MSAVPNGTPGVGGADGADVVLTKKCCEGGSGDTCGDGMVAKVAMVPGVRDGAGNGGGGMVSEMVSAVAARVRRWSLRCWWRW